MLKHTVLVVALAAIYPLQASAAVSAGVAQFIAGDVNVRRSDGRTDALVKGRDLESGQAILTGANGRAQVRFSDGGLISLQPNTEFKIASYVDQADPRQDRFLVDLLRGSMRAITGLIGKRNRDNYKVTTTTATIGIRGSGFNAAYNPDGSLIVTTELDAIEVCNAGGCVGLTAGESALVFNSTDTPVRTHVRAPVPTPGPQQSPIVTGNRVNDDGKSSLLPSAPPAVDPPVTPPVTPPVIPTGDTGTFSNLTAVAHYHFPPASSDPNGSFAGPVVSSAVVMTGGKVNEFEASTSVFKPSATAGDSSLGSIAGNDFIGWGNWTSASKNGSTSLNHLHYIVGQATPVLPTTAGVASYTLVGGSAPTSYTGASGTLFNTSTLSVDFNPSGPMMSVNIQTSFGNVVDNYLYFSSSSFSSGSGNIKGMFTGPNANRAGLVYTGSLNPAGSFSGSAIFQKP